MHREPLEEIIKAQRMGIIVLFLVALSFGIFAMCLENKMHDLENKFIDTKLENSLLKSRPGLVVNKAHLDLVSLFAKDLKKCNDSKR